MAGSTPTMVELDTIKLKYNGRPDFPITRLTVEIEHDPVNRSDDQDQFHKGASSLKCGLGRQAGEDRAKMAAAHLLGKNGCLPCPRGGSNSIMPATKVFDHFGIPLSVHGILSCATNSKAERFSHHNKHILLYIMVCRNGPQAAD